MTSRRTFLARSALTVTGSRLANPRLLHAVPRNVRQCVSPVTDTIWITDADIRTLALRAVDAAKSAGATYADVRLTRRLLDVYTNGQWDAADELVAVGVRALVNGYWGFAASPYWLPDEVTTLARDAVAQAKTYASVGAANTAEWIAAPVASGHWSTPVRIDPFTVTIEEKCDYMAAMMALAERPDRQRSGRMEMYFTREERAVATSDGAYFTQTLHTASGKYEVHAYDMINGAQQHGQADASNLGWTGAGWEFILDAGIPAQIPQLIEDAEANIRGEQTTAGDIGRYDIVVDAATMGAILAGTLGPATQVDRIIGYEANASGTSYLGTDPMAALGTSVAAPLVNVTANRSMPRGLATVKWDDEGVTPDEFSIVRDGTLVDYQTTREQATWLAPWYAKRGSVPRSHGCAASESALTITMQHSPNLVLEPAPKELSFAEMVAATPRGIAITNGGVDMDFQGRNGVIGGTLHRIVNGRLGPRITSIKPLFSTATFWKNLSALGGSRSVQQIGLSAAKGEPTQETNYSVRAVPATVSAIPFVRAP